MTLDEQEALEALVGRSLSVEEVASIDLLMDPDNRDDVQIASILSTGRTRLSSLPKAVFQRWAAKTGIRAVIEDHALNSGSPLRAIALTLRDVLVSDIPAIDFGLEDNVLLLQAWVTAQAITQEQADGLLVLATVADAISVSAVSRALNVAQGRMMLNAGGDIS